jgi:hypothetical protein
LVLGVVVSPTALVLGGDPLHVLEARDDRIRREFQAGKNIAAAGPAPEIISPPASPQATPPASATRSLAQNCTITENHAKSAGGTWIATNQNSIVYYNSVTISAVNHSRSTIENTCTVPDPGGNGNTTNRPQFVNLSTTNLRLLSTSPCIDSGTNSSWMAEAIDLDGLPRIINESVDMGAYESPSPIITGITLSTNSNSSVVEWASFSNAHYIVYGASNLTHGYDILLHADIPASPPQNTFTDTVNGVELRGYAVEYRP